MVELFLVLALNSYAADVDAPDSAKSRANVDQTRRETPPGGSTGTSGNSAGPGPEDLDKTSKGGKQGRGETHTKGKRTHDKRDTGRQNEPASE